MDMIDGHTPQEKRREENRKEVRREMGVENKKERCEENHSKLKIFIAVQFFH